MESKHSNIAATRESPALATLVLSLELGAALGAPTGLDPNGVEPLDTEGSGGSTISAIFRLGPGALDGGCTCSGIILSRSPGLMGKIV